MKLIWIKRAVGGWVTVDGDWTIRPVRGFNGHKPTKLFWVYFKTSRYTPTGSYKDSVFFPTAKDAKQFVQTLIDEQIKKELAEFDSQFPV